MSTPETQKEQADAVEKLATGDLESLKAGIRSAPAGKLDALAQKILEKQKTGKSIITDEVKKEFELRRDELAKESMPTVIEKNLNQLSSGLFNVQLDFLETRLVHVEALIAAKPAEAAPQKKPSAGEQLRQDVGTVTAQVTNAAGVAYNFARTAFLKPLADSTQNIFLLGPLINSLAELSPQDVKNFVSRKWNQMFLMAEPLAKANGLGFFSGQLRKMADASRQNLAILDMQDVVEEYKREEKAGETITFDTKISADVWKKLQDLAAKSPDASQEGGNPFGDRMAAFITQQRSAGVLEIKVTCADIAKSDTEVQDAAKISRQKALHTKMLALPVWKDAVVTSVAPFSETETSLTNGILTVAEGDIGPDGGLKNNAEGTLADTPARTLVEARKILTNAEKIVVSKSADELITVDWTSPKTVTVPSKLPANNNLEKVNDLASDPRPDYFSVLKIGPSDEIGKKQILLQKGLLIAENDTEVLAALKGDPLKNKNEPPPAKYDYAGGSFTYVTPNPMPAKATP